MSKQVDGEYILDLLRSTKRADLVLRGLKMAEDVIRAAQDGGLAPVRRGRWEPDNDRYGWSCTACGHFIQRDFVTEITIPSELLPRYCPNCGAKMDGGDGDV